ncbi:FmdB family zinc ribbon protein [Gordonia sp. (in: high G+C Gram-positive bacteria)]|uniref:FmdB family zinc ribbon protein n=1 Tax=Gordonia sp. (in: high G+C Gram-positive bacteria) TaxID=84139 RepID=UPI003C78F009
MPTYSYACTVCDNKFDIQQAFSDDSLTQCPQCDGRLRKLFNSVGIVFKGSGFYRTDSRSGGGSVAAGSSEAGSSSSDSSSSGGSSSSSSSKDSSSSSASKPAAATAAS